MKKMLFLLSVAAMAMLFSGCASIISKSEYTVAVTTNAPKAEVTVRNPGSGFVISSGEAPYAVNLKSSDGLFSSASYMFEIKDLETNKKQIRIINGSLCPWFFGNFFLGGIIGMGIDGATGAMYELDEAVYVHFSEYDN